MPEIGDTFNLRADHELTALDHECGKSNDLGDIAQRELLATWRARGTSRAEAQHIRNGIVVKHLRARHRRVA